MSKLKKCAFSSQYCVKGDPCSRLIPSMIATQMKERGQDKELAEKIVRSSWSMLCKFCKSRKEDKCD